MLGVIRLGDTTTHGGKVIYLAIKDASKNGVCRSGTDGWQ
jgi:uncharacterized Zn-binding protein involved in type VI secretion